MADKVATTKDVNLVDDGIVVLEVDAEPII